jgi:hypothetical protein
VIITVTVSQGGEGAQAVCCKPDQNSCCLSSPIPSDVPMRGHRLCTTFRSFDLLTMTCRGWLWTPARLECTPSTPRARLWTKVPFESPHGANPPITEHDHSMPITLLTQHTVRVYFQIRHVLFSVAAPPPTTAALCWSEQPPKTTPRGGRPEPETWPASPWGSDGQSLTEPRRHQPTLVVPVRRGGRDKADAAASLWATPFGTRCTKGPRP